MSTEYQVIFQVKQIGGDRWNDYCREPLIASDDDQVAKWARRWFGDLAARHSTDPSAWRARVEIRPNERNTGESRQFMVEGAS